MTEVVRQRGQEAPRDGVLDEEEMGLIRPDEENVTPRNDPQGGIPNVESGGVTDDERSRRSVDEEDKGRGPSLGRSLAGGHQPAARRETSDDDDRGGEQESPRGPRSPDRS